MPEGRDLALTGGAMNASKPSELCSKKLWDLAAAAADGDERRAKILAISKSAELRAEAAQAIPYFERMVARPSNQELYSALQPMLLIKRRPDFGPGVEGERIGEAWLAIYYTHLRNFPIYAIRAGVHALIGTHIYPDMPQPAELVKAVEPFAVEIRTAHYRLKEAMRLEHKTVREIDRQANLEAMRAAGWLDAAGNVDPLKILSSAKPQPSTHTGPKETPHQMAARIRREA